MTWGIVFTKQAQRDAKKLADAGLKDKAGELLEIIRKTLSKLLLGLKNWWGTLPGLIHAASLFSTEWSTKSWNSKKSSKSSACGPIMNEAGGHAAGATPDPIPNPFVKPRKADGTGGTGLRPVTHRLKTCATG